MPPTGRSAPINESDRRARWQLYEVPVGPPRQTDVRAPDTRYRKALTNERSSEANRIHQGLEDAGVTLSALATDVMGASRRDMMRALIVMSHASTSRCSWQIEVKCRGGRRSPALVEDRAVEALGGGVMVRRTGRDALVTQALRGQDGAEHRDVVLGALVSEHRPHSDTVATAPSLHVVSQRCPRSPASP
jgi:hypothetical protein